jgi:hypothetical protein
LWKKKTHKVTCSVLYTLPYVPDWELVWLPHAPARRKPSKLLQKALLGIPFHTSTLTWKLLEHKMKKLVSASS